MGSKIILGAPMELVCDVGKVEGCFGMLAQDRSTVGDERTIGLEIVLGTPD
jgi:hypothetical protein